MITWANTIGRGVLAIEINEHLHASRRKILSGIISMLLTHPLQRHNRLHHDSLHSLLHQFLTLSRIYNSLIYLQQHKQFINSSSQARTCFIDHIINDVIVHLSDDVSYSVQQDLSKSLRTILTRIFDNYMISTTHLEGAP